MVLYQFGFEHSYDKRVAPPTVFIRHGQSNSVRGQLCYQDFKYFFVGPETWVKKAFVCFRIFV